MLVWYPCKSDLKNYVETFNVSERDNVKRVLRKAIIAYDRYLSACQKENTLLPSYCSFGAFLNYLETRQDGSQLAMYHQELYGFSRWYPDEDTLDFLEFSGYWPELIESLLLECASKASNSVMDPEAYFITFLARKYSLTRVDPAAMTIPSQWIPHLERATGKPYSVIQSRMRVISQEWAKSGLSRPELYYRFIIERMNHHEVVATNAPVLIREQRILSYEGTNQPAASSDETFDVPVSSLSNAHNDGETLRAHVVQMYQDGSVTGRSAVPSETKTGERRTRSTLELSNETRQAQLTFELKKKLAVLMIDIKQSEPTLSAEAIKAKALDALDSIQRNQHRR